MVNIEMEEGQKDGEYGHTESAPLKDCVREMPGKIVVQNVNNFVFI